MLWIYTQLYPENLREITLAKGHCANIVRHQMKDERSKTAVDVAIEFGEGKATREELTTASDGAFDAVGSYAGVCAASAAYVAATTTYAAMYVVSYAVKAMDDVHEKSQKQTADICRRHLSVGDEDF